MTQRGDPGFSPEPTTPAEARPRVGVSACLLGHAVRFDGGHKKSDFVQHLSRHVELVPVCPEVDSGMFVPRETVRLVASRGRILLRGNRSGEDHAGRQRAWAGERIPALGAGGLDGFILKKGSPSCGLERVRVYDDDVAGGVPARTGTGIFATLVREHLPDVALTEEGWLQDAALREAFLSATFAHHRLRTGLLRAPSRERLVAFHTEHKLLFLAHSPARYRSLGRAVARIDQPLPIAVHTYAAEAMAALRERATTGKHANVLQHILGFLKEALSPFEKREVLELIDEFRGGIHDLAVPRTLLLHHTRKHTPRGWLSRQVYFRPYPSDLGLRNHS